MSSTKRSTIVTLSVVLAAGLLLRVFNISYPAKPVFDEAHFATYAAAYASHRPHFDIHPPLGKVFYAIALSLTPSRASTYTSVEFIRVDQDPSNHSIRTTTTATIYGAFPYVALRLVSAAFGLLLTLSVFWFLSGLTKNRSVALWGAFFVTIDNALLLQTRLILLDGMYLSLGFLALALLFSGRVRPWLAGVLWGLALSVKLIAIVFLGPLVAAIAIMPRGAERSNAWKNFAVFAMFGLAILTTTMLTINAALVPLNERITLYQSVIRDFHPEAVGGSPRTPAVFRAIIPYLKISAVEAFFSLSGYTTGVPPHPYQSSWYTWPVMQKPMVFFVDAVGSNKTPLVLVGNPALWTLGLVALLIAAVSLVFRKPKRFSTPTQRSLLVLMGGFASSLLPFILVQRTTFLYHYLPALIFSFCLAAVLLGSADTTPSAARARRTLGLIVVAAALAGFLAVAPYTFGLSTGEL